MRCKRLSAGRGFGGNIEIKLGLFIFEMDCVVGLDLNGPERIGSRGEVVGEIGYENQPSEEEQYRSDAGHRFQVTLPAARAGYFLDDLASPIMSFREISLSSVNAPIKNSRRPVDR